MEFGRSVLLLLTALLLSHSVYAQYTEDDGGIETKNGHLRYLCIGAGATYQVMNDPSISPIWYSRVGVQPMIGNIKVNQTSYSEVSMRASSMNLTHNVDKPLKPKVKTQRALVDYRYLVKLPTEMMYYDFRVGAILSGYFGYKNAPILEDAAKVYEYAASLGLCGKITKEVTVRGKTSFLTWDLAIPLLANTSRPYYLNRQELADPENNVIGDFFRNNGTGSFGRYFRVNSRAGLIYRLDNGNAVQISYQWDYTRFKTFNKAYFAEHIVSVIFMFNY
ncbi:MAG: hypothetical protein KDC07_04905 [Chitinophagaceae bacterium]|nr:hypothetical protein [Chitinophagaceae bacterium]MCB9046707.1 hypothetical protein [Chitinophagales bacterium]